MMALTSRRVSATQFACCGDEIGLGGAVSSVLPENRFDTQPLRSEDHSFVLAADVRLDNRAELARDLDLTGVNCLADSHILLRAWQRWDAACLDHIVGAFAFVVWNSLRRELFAARDHAGEKPLHYVDQPGFFALASMPATLLTLPGVDGSFTENALRNLLMLAPGEPAASYFAAVSRLPPGHFLKVTQSQTVVRRYWDPCAVKPLRLKRDEDYAASLRDVFDTATAARLRTTGAIGSQLSAGLDSSSVTTSAALLLAHEQRRLTVFTSVPRPDFTGEAPPGRLPDEGPGARAVAALYPNIDHLCLDTSGVNLVETLHTWTDAVQEPISNLINVLWLERIQAEGQRLGLNVMLNGQGGNATISQFGYQALATWFRQGRWLRLAQSSARMRSKGLLSWHRALEAATEGLLPDWLTYRLRRDAREHTFDYSIAHPSIVADPELRERVLRGFYGARDLRADRMALFERVDHGGYNAGQFSMSGAEQRDPTADKRVYEFCFAIPVEQYVAGDQTRSLARRAMAPRLPPETLTRTVRGIQGGDWYVSMREALPQLRDLLPELKRSAAVARLIDVPRVEHALASFPESGAGGWATSFTYGDSICRGFAFGYFLGRDHAAEAKATVRAILDEGYTLPAPPAWAAAT